MNAFPTSGPTSSSISSFPAWLCQKISLSELNQNVTIVALSLWPALSVLALVARSAAPRCSFRVSSLSLPRLRSCCPSTNPRRSRWSYRSAAFLLAWKWRTAVIRALAGLWCLAFVLVLPVDFAAYNAGWHMAPWLPNSARARIILWEYTAERVLEHPWLGIGVEFRRIA